MRQPNGCLIFQLLKSEKLILSIKMDGLSYTSVVSEI